MANLIQLKMLEGLNGFLLVDKPAGIAFSTVVKTVKRLFNLVKVGHGGSLETMASGLMVLLINDANARVDEVMAADRVYTGTMRLNAATDTGDVHGRPTASPLSPVSLADLKGDIFLAEPRYCAIRREGAADYEVVDTGEHAEALTHIYRFDFSGEAFELKAAKNLIVRSLAQAMGATLLTLRRTRVGAFSVDDAIPFERLLKTEPKDFAACVMPLSRVLR